MGGFFPRYKRYFRAFLLSSVILVKFVVLISALFFISTINPLYSNILRVMSIGVVAYIILKQRNPSYNMAWIVFILIFPIAGGVIYLLGGNKKLPRKLKKRIKAFDQTPPTVEDFPVLANSDLETNFTNQLEIKYTNNIAGFPAYQNSTCKFFSDARLMFDEMIIQLKMAKKTIFLEYFIISEGYLWGNILDVLKQKALEGVEIRLIYDDFGSITKLPKNYFETLSQAGIKSIVFNPCKTNLTTFLNYRDHRKLCIIDGNVGFCGGANLSDEYINYIPQTFHWKDTGVMVKGDAVYSMTLMFHRMWCFCCPECEETPHIFAPTVNVVGDGIVQPFPDTPLDNLTVSKDNYINAINSAREYAYIASPYLILDYDTSAALCRMAMSGVDIRIVTPAVPDKWYVHLLTRSYYPDLLKSGVRIFEYTPGFIHSKQILCDDKLAFVGTANMDFRSFYLHYECCVGIYNSSALTDIKEDFQNLFDVSNEIDLTETTKYKGILHNVFCAFLRLFAPLF